jgi:Cys-rich protein (TIGR01571 family)
MRSQYHLDNDDESTTPPSSRIVTTPSTTAAKLVRIVAPATLNSGFTFEAIVDNKSFLVVVPEGGVKEGEEFEIPHPNYDDDDEDEDDEDKDPDSPISNVHRIPDDEEVQRLLHDEYGVPRGGWRTTLCSCCDVCTQATFWMAIFCIPILYAQILTRLHLTWKAEEGKPEETIMTFNRIVMTLLFILAFGTIPMISYIGIIISFCIFVYVGAKLRTYMRTKYDIPASILGRRIHPKFEDFCVSCFCACCSGIQMARHTHDDKEWPGSCCTTTGLEYGAPDIVNHVLP